MFLVCVPRPSFLPPRCCTPLTSCGALCAGSGHRAAPPQAAPFTIPALIPRSSSSIPGHSSSVRGRCFLSAAC
eukprot:365956-Chlamydomonas_euryale.AAC.9